MNNGKNSFRTSRKFVDTRRITQHNHKEKIFSVIISKFKIFEVEANLRKKMIDILIIAAYFQVILNDLTHLVKLPWLPTYFFCNCSHYNFKFVYKIGMRVFVLLFLVCRSYRIMILDILAKKKNSLRK